MPAFPGAAEPRGASLRTGPRWLRLRTTGPGVGTCPGSGGGCAGRSGRPRAVCGLCAVFCGERVGCPVLGKGQISAVCEHGSLTSDPSYEMRGAGLLSFIFVIYLVSRGYPGKLEPDFQKLSGT